MRNTITARIETGELNSSGEKIFRLIDGTIASPFVNSMLQDERLDEANLIIYNCPTATFERGRRVRVHISSTSDGEVKTLDKTYIVANDNSVEMPIGSGKYKHELYIIEETKLLEGIMCQSICFTNTSENNYLTNVKAVAPTFTEGKGNISDEDLLNLSVYTSPVDSGKSLTVKSLEEVGAYLCTAIDKYNGGETYINSRVIGSGDPRGGSKTTYSAITVQAGDTQTTYTCNPDDTNNITLYENIVINPSPTMVITYKVLVQTTSKGSMSPAVFEFIFSYTLTAVDNKYRTKLWTVTDCINRVLELAQPIYAGEKPQYTLDGVTYSAGKITGYSDGSQAAKYDKMLAPEFTMTQCTLREQLKIIGGYINAEPRLSGDKIYFDEYGGTGKQSTMLQEYISKSHSASINDFCTQVDTTAQNLVNTLDYAQGVTFSPNAYDMISLRTESINIRVTEENGMIYTQFPIYQIQQVKCTAFNEDGTIFKNMSEIDITPYVVEETEYMSNMSSYDSTYPTSKAYAIYYTQGVKNIKGLFFKVPNAISRVFSKYAIVNILSRASGQNVSVFDNINYPLLSFRVAYVPIYSSRFSHGKQRYNGLTAVNFTAAYNQSDNLIETRYYGENVKGAVARLGNISGAYTYIAYDIDNIPQLGEMIDKYIITSVSTTYYKTFVKVTLGLSIDYQNISQYVGVHSNKRIYEVSERQAYKRDILLRDIMVCTRNESSVPSSTLPLITGNGIVAYLGTFKAYSEKEDIDKSYVNAVQAYGTRSNRESELGKVRLPVTSSAFGNAIVFSWAYKDNYSAGVQVKEIPGYIQSGNDQLSGYVQSDVPYGDYWGRLYYYYFMLLPNKAMIDVPLGPLGRAMALPSVSGTTNNLHLADCQALRIRKDSREVLSVNYEIETQTNEEDIIIGSALAKNCPLVTSVAHGAPVVKFFAGTIGKFEGNISNRTDLRGTKSITVYSDSISFAISTAPFYSWAIVTPENTYTIDVTDDDGDTVRQEITTGGDIIIASNKPWTDYAGKTAETLYFKPVRG